MTFACPHCGHEIEKPGSWFKARHEFECDACREEVVLTYPVKVALFARYGET